MTDNKRITNKQILKELQKIRKDFEIVDVDIRLNEEDLKTICTGVISRMMKLKSMESWFDHVSKTETAWNSSYKNLEMTEEEDAVSEAAKLMTLLNLFEDKEEYEKCAIVKNRLDEINKILKKY